MRLDAPDEIAVRMRRAIVHVNATTYSEDQKSYGRQYAMHLAGVKKDVPNLCRDANSIREFIDKLMFQ